MEIIIARRHQHILRLLTEQEVNQDGIRTKYMKAKDIYHMLEKKYCRATIYRDLKKLEELKLLNKSLYSGERRNYYSLSMTGMDLIENPSSRHSFLLSRVLRDMADKLSRVRAYYYPNEIACRELGLDTSQLAPDAILKVLSKDEELVNCAFELELTQKNTDRIVAKFKKYGEDKYFTRVLYFFEFERDYEKYLSIFEDFISRMKLSKDTENAFGKFLFAFNTELDSSDSKIEMTAVTFKSKTSTFNNLLHDKSISHSLINKLKH